MTTEALDKLIDDALVSNSTDKRRLGAEARKELIMLRVDQLEGDRRPTSERLSLRRELHGAVKGAVKRWAMS